MLFRPVFLKTAFGCWFTITGISCSRHLLEATSKCVDQLKRRLDKANRRWNNYRATPGCVFVYNMSLCAHLQSKTIICASVWCDSYYNQTVYCQRVKHFLIGFESLLNTFNHVKPAICVLSCACLYLSVCMLCPVCLQAFTVLPLLTYVVLPCWLAWTESCRSVFQGTVSIHRIKVKVNIILCMGVMENSQFFQFNIMTFYINPCVYLKVICACILAVYNCYYAYSRPTTMPQSRITSNLPTLSHI